MAETTDFTKKTPKSPNATNAKRFDPVVIWRSTDRTKIGTPAEYQFPGDARELPPPGFISVTLDNLPAMHRFTKSYNEAVRRQQSEEREIVRMHFDKSIADRRADALRKVWHNPRALALLKACQEYVDRKRERKYMQKIEPNFHIQPVAFDASNRQGHASEETGWRDKKA